ncbi:ABC transporter ATP-binding protein [Corynebacterium aquatimens]
MDNVVKRFGEKTAVNGLSFEVGAGEIFALLGPNGAGKTTTIEMCEGFGRPDSGRITVLGLDPQKEPEKVRSRIGIMLQGGGSYSGIKVREMLNLTASYNKDPLDPEWLIELFGLSGVANTTYRRLSGGQQQRLSFALALIGRPELVFLDEPTAGMDAQTRRATWDLIGALREDGVTVILTTHMMPEAEALADQIAIIDHGKLIAWGTPAEITSSDHTPFIEITTDRPLDLTEKWRDASGKPVVLTRSGELSYQIEGDPSPDLIAAVAHEAACQGVLIHQLGVARKSLEDVFLDLTGRELRS